jgi:hypothetical protein
VMLGFNRKDEKSLPFQNAFIPLYVWIRDHTQVDIWLSNNVFRVLGKPMF